MKKSILFSLLANNLIAGLLSSGGGVLIVSSFVTVNNVTHDFNTLNSGTMAEAVTSVITSGYLMFDNKCNSFNATIFCEADTSILLAAADEGTATLGGIGQPGA